jgi:hypothetical protein
MAIFLPFRDLDLRKQPNMPNSSRRTVCWSPLWNEARPGSGLEHLLLGDQAADSVVLGWDAERGPFRLSYRLMWDQAWRLQKAELEVTVQDDARSMHLMTDGQGRWLDGQGNHLDALQGCGDIDIWPTPFTNSFPIRRTPFAIGERHEFRMAWVDAIEMTVRPKPQAYTRLAERLYLFESLDGSGFKAELPVDEHGIVLDYPGLFRRVQAIQD